MSDNSNIEWCDATWNIITGCSVESPACTNCYAMRLAGTRLREHHSRKGLTKIVNGKPAWTGEVRFNEQWLMQPLQWKRPRKIFVCAHADLFHPNVPDEWIDRIFAVMALAPHHTFMVLTKRAERMHTYLKRLTEMCDGEDGIIHIVTPVASKACVDVHNMPDEWPLPNVMLGVTAEDQQRADERIPVLLATPAAKRFISIEPMLGQVDLRQIHGFHNGATPQTHDALSGYSSDTPYGYVASKLEYPFSRGKLDLVICGGESGPGARPPRIEWVRSIRDQCAAAGVPFFFKQWGEFAPDDPAANRTAMRHVGKKAAGRLLDGVEHNGTLEDQR